MNTYVGPAKVVCPLTCDIPEGLTATEVPRPRHNWGDVVLCPNEYEDGTECPIVLLVRKS